MFQNRDRWHSFGKDTQPISQPIHIETGQLPMMVKPPHNGPIQHLCVVGRADQHDRIWKSIDLQEQRRNHACYLANITPFIHTYAKLPIGSLLLDSCFTEAGFVLILRPEPEPSSPQADTVELTAIFLKFIAALTSRW